MTALWVHEVADRFWADVGDVPPAFPRDLIDVACWALTVDAVELPDLSIAAVNGWLAQRSGALRLPQADRRLRACILVHEGHGLLFVDATDPDDERRFSVAHEIAHYLVEHAAPRRQARTRLGEDILPVLTGRRAASRDERLGAVLGGVSLATRLHLMERTPDGHLPGHDVSAAEQQADALAFELLAPVDAVRACLPVRAGRAAIEDTLQHPFGLPAAPARAYARILAPAPTVDPLVRRLFGPARDPYARS